MLRTVSEVADMEARLVPASRYVDPVFKRKVGSAGFVGTAVEHAGLFFVARLVLRGSSSMRVPATGIFRPPPSGLWLTGECLCHVEFQVSPEDARNWFVGSDDVKNTLHRIHFPRWMQAYFFTSDSPLIRGWDTRENDRQNRGLLLIL